nr:hypothetical protein CFP56_18276 [Quercus suber]
MEYTTLKQISVDKDNSTVKVRVLQLRNVVNISNDHDLINLGMILVDKEEAEKSLAFSVNWNCLYICWFATCGGFKACAIKGLHFPHVHLSTCLVSIDVFFVQGTGNLYTTNDMELDDAMHMASLMLKEGDEVISFYILEFLISLKQRENPTR